MTQQTTEPTPYRSTPEAIMRELLDTHAVEAYLADNLLSAKAERDEALAEVERLTGLEARERLARHLYITARGRNDESRAFAASIWDASPSAELRHAWRSRADEALAVIAGKEG